MKNKKIIIMLLIIVFIMFLNNPNIYATDSIIQGADNFLKLEGDIILDTAVIKKTSDTIFNIFSIIGTVTVLVVGAILGIQFIMGSTEEKAKVKETLFPYIIGSVVVFGAIGIWSLAVKVASGIFN